MDRKDSQFMAALAASALDDVPTPASNAKNVVALLNEEENLAEGVLARSSGEDRNHSNTNSTGQ